MYRDIASVIVRGRLKFWFYVGSGYNHGYQWMILLMSLVSLVQDLVCLALTPKNLTTT